MVEITIESGVAIPEPRNNAVMRSIQNALADMKIGESFAYPDKSRSAVSVAIHRYKKAGGRSVFTYRKDGAGYRVWRIE